MPAVSGVVRVVNASGVLVPARRLLRVYERDSGQLVAATLSDAVTGAYAVTVPTISEYFVVRHDLSDVDPLWHKVVVALRMDGQNNATVFSDAKGKTFSVTGGAKTVTGQSAFGTACASFDGNGSYIKTVDSLSDFVFGSGDFSIEFFIKTIDSNFVVVDFYTANQPGWQVYVTPSGYLQFYTAAPVKTGGKKINDGAYHFVQIIRSSGQLYFVVDSVMDGAAANYATSLSYQSVSLAVGAQVAHRNTAYDFSGLLHDLRITKGVARELANLVTPTSSFPQGASGGVEADQIIGWVISK